MFSLCVQHVERRVSVCIKPSESFRAVGNVNIGFVTCVGVEELGSF